MNPLRAMIAQEYFLSLLNSVIFPGKMFRSNPFSSAFFDATLHISSDKSVPSAFIPFSARCNKTAPVPQAISITPSLPYFFAKSSYSRQYSIIVGIKHNLKG